MVTTNDDNPAIEEGARPERTFRPGNKTASTKDILVGETRREHGGRYFDPAETLAIGSENPEVFLPLGRHTARQLARDMRIIATMNVVHSLETHMPQVMWFGYQGAIGVNGQGRNDLLKAIGARRDRFDQERGMNGMHARFSNSNDNAASGNGRLTS